MKHFIILLCLCLLMAACEPKPDNPDLSQVASPSTKIAETVVIQHTNATPLKAVPPAATPVQLDINTLPLFNQAQKANPDRYKYAEEKSARFVPTSDGRSFYVVWTPKDFDKAPIRPVIISLHGHASWAFDEFYLWHPYAEKRGYAIIALQWWFGTGEEMDDYYLPNEMFPLFEKELRSLAIEPGKVLLHGFSRGSANSYAMTALDHQSRRLISLTISNAGGMIKNFPPNAAILNGGFGAEPFKDIHWVMYCGGKDPNPERDGCEGMQAARDLVTGYGAIVDLFIQDPAGDHGGFQRNPAYVNQALDVFDKLIGK